MINYKSSEYTAWREAKARCRNPKHRAYRDYGGRGIKFCRRWDTFLCFLKDMGERPSDKHTLERKDNSKGYSPNNCRWATMKEQSNNRRSNVFVEVNGIRKTMSQWADVVGGNRHMIRDRLKKGWPIEMAVSIPANWTMVDLWKSKSKRSLNERQ